MYQRDVKSNCSLVTVINRELKAITSSDTANRRRGGRIYSTKSLMKSKFKIKIADNESTGRAASPNSLHRAGTCHTRVD